VSCCVFQVTNLVNKTQTKKVCLDFLK